MPGDVIFNWDDIVVGLKPYTRGVISEFYDAPTSDYREVLLRLTGEKSNVKVYVTGKSVQSSGFADRVIEEFNEFLCKPQGKYEKIHSQMVQASAALGYVFVAALAGAIASVCGFVISLVAPLVAILLKAAFSMGVNAWCRGTDPDDAH
jgi:hypothetical protein